MEVYSTQPSAIVEALHSGQRQGVAAGIIFSFGAMWMFKMARRNVLQKVNVDRKVKYSFPK